MIHKKNPSLLNNVKNAVIPWIYKEYSVYTYTYTYIYIYIYIYIYKITVRYTINCSSCLTFTYIISDNSRNVTHSPETKENYLIFCCPCILQKFLVNNQLDASIPFNIFIYFQRCTFFEHYMLIIRRDQIVLTQLLVTVTPC
jgi:hypothetical protein